MGSITERYELDASLERENALCGLIHAAAENGALPDGSNKHAECLFD